MLGLAWTAAPHASAPSSVPTRVVAIGDIHGDFDSFVSLLRQARLIDEHNRWSGGMTTLVQTGDFTDRGTKVREVIDLLMSLEAQARQSGGRILVTLGNHEVMNLLREVRDVAPAAYLAFADEHSEARRVRAYREYADFMTSRAAALGADLRIETEEEWRRSHPAGFVEYVAGFEADGVYGRWLRSKPVVTVLDGTAFLHAGINPETAPRSLDDVNRRVRTEIRRFDEYRRYLIDRRIILPAFTLAEIVDAVATELAADNRRQAADVSGVVGLRDDAFDRGTRNVLEAVLRIGTWDLLRPDGPLWFRGFATWSSEEGLPLVVKLREKYNIARWVVGHTIPKSMRVTPRFDSSVFLIDTGMLSSHYVGGRASALEIAGGRFTAISLHQPPVLLAAAELVPPS